MNLEIRRGEVFGLIGPKHSGKSTILRLLTGQLHPTEGKVKVFGRSLRWPSVKKRIGYLSQNSGHHPRAGWLGWVDTLLGRWHGGRVGLVNAPFPVQQNRGRLAQVLVGKPELFLLDEPFAGLDLTQRREMGELILNLTQQGRTVVLSSRQLSAVSSVCDQIAILFRGEIQAVGTLTELLALPEAVRVTAPVLPPETMERLRKIICEELRRESDLQQPAQSAPIVQSAADDADDFLASRTMVAPPKLPEETPAAIDPINHAKLAELTKKARPTSQ